MLEKLAEEYPIVSKILEYRQLAKLKSTYADGLAVFIGDDGRIHGKFNQTVTATGRLSSTEPNLQKYSGADGTWSDDQESVCAKRRLCFLSMPIIRR